MDPPWTDYVSAFGSVVGILIAGLALIYAVNSAAEARKSAEASDAIANASKATLTAAKQQLDIARQAHRQDLADRSRRPAVDSIELSEVSPQPGESADGVFRISFKNTGDRVLADAVLTVLLDRGSKPQLTDRWARPVAEQPDDEATERWPGPQGAPRSLVYLARPITCQIGVAHTQYVRLQRRGQFAVRVRLFHAELEGGGRWIDAFVEVQEDRAARLVADRPTTDGRLDEFDLSAP